MSQQLLRRKLLALDLPGGGGFTPMDESAFRNMLVTLEDTKIRLRKIEDRASLRDIAAQDWVASCRAYLEELQCPLAATAWDTREEDRVAMLDWVLGRAVALEYADNVDEYNAAGKAVAGASASGAGADGAAAAAAGLPFDVDSAACTEALVQLAALLKVPSQGIEPALLWRAVAKLVRRKFAPSAITAAKQQAEKPDMLTLEETPLGFTVDDPVVQQAAKVLRLLHVAELRQLQTQINELIVTVQNITAAPKTDTRLGKVGR